MSSDKETKCQECSKWPLPELRVCPVVINRTDNVDHVLLIKGGDNWKGLEGLPEGNAQYLEDPRDGVIRVLKGLTGLEGKKDSVQLVTVHGNLQRDPSGHTVVILYEVEVDNTDALKNGRFVKFRNPNSLKKEVPELALDHFSLLEAYSKWAKNKK